MGDPVRPRDLRHPAGAPREHQCLAEALRARGHTVEAAPWNGPFAPFACAGAVVLSATWDYHAEPVRFREWLARVVPATFNPPELVRWNLEKTTWRLARRDCRRPRWFPRRPGSIADALRAITPCGRLLVQEFVPEIADGELAGVFFDGVFSHGLRRVPAVREFRVKFPVRRPHGGGDAGRGHGLPDDGRPCAPARDPCTRESTASREGDASS